MHGQETRNPKESPETLLHDDGDPGLEWREWAVSSYRLAGVDNVVQPKQSRLYWIGGPFHTGFETQKGQFAESVLRGVVNLLDEYRNACQQQYIAFNGVCNGRNLAYERFKSSVDPASMDNTISVGTAFPDSGQSPGASTIASISIREFLRGLKQNGDFENQHAKAFLVFIYHLWDERYRPAIGKLLSVDPKKQVLCDLMGDLRRVRNLIIHNDSIVPKGFANRLTMLQEIWNLQRGELKLTENMIHSLMEQINAIRVNIAAAAS